MSAVKMDQTTGTAPNSQSAINRSLEAKIVVLGTQGVGKTSVVVRYVGNMFNKHVSPTIGASFFICKMILDNYRVKLQVWDTAGQERFRSMAPMYYRKANAAMLVYDITNENSFEDMKSWVHELRKNVDGKLVLCVLGNKCDLELVRQVSRQDALEYARSINALYFETSALSNEGIQESFCEVTRELITMYEEMPNSGINVLETYRASTTQTDNRVQLHTSASASSVAAPVEQDNTIRRLCC